MLRSIGCSGIYLDPLALGALLVQFPGCPLPAFNLVSFGWKCAGRLAGHHC